MIKSGRKLRETPSQTSGPFIHLGCTPNYLGVNSSGSMDLGSTLMFPDTEGKRITLAGKVFDGENNPIKDGIIEIWHADASGRYRTSNKKYDQSGLSFIGWGRSCCDFKSGLWKFETIKPGPVVNGGQRLAPHISFWLVARGINMGLNTRMYFEDEYILNQKDELLNSLKKKRNVETLLARKISDINYEFNIYLQGKNETIFFEI